VVLAPIASAPERIGPREVLDVLVDGDETLLLPQPSTSLTAASAREAWLRCLPSLQSGSVLEISEERGPGFTSLRPSPPPSLPITLASLLLQPQDLLVLATGTTGMAGVAAMLDWPRLELHQQRHRVVVLVEVKDVLHGCCQAQVQKWREIMKNVRVVPVMRRGGGKEGGLEEAVFEQRREGGRKGLRAALGVTAEECAVVLAGFGEGRGGGRGEGGGKEGERVASLVTLLMEAGVDPARVLGEGLEEGGKEGGKGAGAKKGRSRRRKGRNERGKKGEIV
jgi:hypothetical protein